jgi:hypothetical protein
MKLMMLSLELPIRHKSLTLLNAKCHKAKPETVLHGLAIVNDKFQIQMNGSPKKEELDRNSWRLLAITIAAIRTSIYDYENESHCKCVEDKSYSVKNTDRGVTRHDLINRFLLEGYLKNMSSFFTSAFISMMLQNDLLMKSFITYHLWEDGGIPTKFLCICVVIVSMINQTMSDSLQNNVRPLGKDTRGG